MRKWPGVGEVRRHLNKRNSSTKGGNYCVSKRTPYTCVDNEHTTRTTPERGKVLSRELFRELVDALNVLYSLVKHAFCRLSQPVPAPSNTHNDQPRRDARTGGARAK